MRQRGPRFTLFPYTTLFRSDLGRHLRVRQLGALDRVADLRLDPARGQQVVAHGRRERLQVDAHAPRSEEHTSELQSRLQLVCRLLLEKKKGFESSVRKNGQL